MIGYIIGCILMIILVFFIYCCLNISNKYSERELHEVYDEAYKNYREDYRNYRKRVKKQKKDYREELKKNEVKIRKHNK